MDVRFDNETRHILKRIANALEKIANEPQPTVLLDKESVRKALTIGEEDGN